MKRWLLSLLVVPLLLGAGCATSSVATLPPNVQTATTLPEEPPSDFTVSWQAGGGMAPTGSEASLIGHHVHREDRNFVGGQIVTTASDFTLTDAEYAAMYAFLQTNHADTVRTSGEVYDGDNDSYTLSWGGASIYARRLTVVDEDQDRFATVYAYLTDLFTPRSD